MGACKFEFLPPTLPPEMDFHILGRLEVLDEARETVAVAGSKQRALLALLLLHGNETLSTSRLIDELGGEAPVDGGPRMYRDPPARVRCVCGYGAGGGVRWGCAVTRMHRHPRSAHGFSRFVCRTGRSVQAGPATGG